jgi:hypothetical protein
LRAVVRVATRALRRFLTLRMPPTRPDRFEAIARAAAVCCPQAVAFHKLIW